jgi:hypothetical protein
MQARRVQHVEVGHVLGLFHFHVLEHVGQPVVEAIGELLGVRPSVVCAASWAASSWSMWRSQPAANKEVASRVQDKRRSGDRKVSACSSECRVFRYIVHHLRSA